MHCGQPAGASSLPGFCCLGCQTVHRILSSGPFSDYYRIRREGVCFEKGGPVELRSGDYSFWNQSTDFPLRIFVEGIHCTACVWLLERLPLALPGDVVSSHLDLSRSQLTVETSPGADRARIGAAIESFGYRPHLIGSRSEGERLLEKENRKRLIDVGIAGALAGNVMLMSIPLYSGVEGRYRDLFEWLSFALALPVVFHSGRSFFQNVAAGFRNRVFPVDGPILLAVLVALFYSGVSLVRGTHDLYFDSLTALVFLLLASRYYLARVRHSSGLNPGVLGFFHTPFNGAPGDVVCPRSGESLGFDGRILRGRAWVDQAHFTGEADPVLFEPGDELHAGCRIVEADPQLEVRVEEVGSGTRLQKLLARIEDSRGRRATLEQSTERWARYLLGGVTILAAISMVLFIRSGMPAEGLKRVLALLIVTCPCALALATPFVYSLASGILLKQGVLLKTPDALDRILGVRDMYLDKTGTLTCGQLRIPGEELEGLKSEERAILAALTGRSNHPVSRAIFRELSGGVGEFVLAKPEFIREIPGVGVEGVFSGMRYGLRKHPAEKQFGVQFYRKGDGARSEEMIEIAVIHFEDRIRPDSAEVANALVRKGLRLHLLTGDHSHNALAMAGELPMTLAASLTPEQKAERAAKGAMVGDGVNDALALARARVGIAVQGGMEAAIESADAYCLKPGISGVLLLVDMARKVRKVLISNFTISTAYNLIGAVLALKGWMSPLLAAVLMPVAATTVFLNSIWRMKRPRT
jgi:cation transport ATPase